MSTLLRVHRVSKSFPRGRDLLGRPTGWLTAVDDVDLELQRGQTLALVGESGCGKSTLARVILRLVPATSGEVWFEGHDVLAMPPAELQAFRRQAQMVFQDPYGSLDPRMQVGDSLTEGVAAEGLTRHARRARVAELLDLVGLPSSAAERYPHEFSGGQRQRISIARALAVRPSLIIADEPTSALDMSVQSSILNLLSSLQRDLSISYVFISHDMSIVRHMADVVAVMYLGRIVEQAPTEELFARPRHPYTQALLSAVPSLAQRRIRRRILARGEATAGDDLTGCRFAPRCARALDQCRSEAPALTEEPSDVSGTHRVACWNPGTTTPVDAAEGTGATLRGR